jgi:hypothetical protein
MHLKKIMQSEMHRGKWTQMKDKQVKAILPIRHMYRSKQLSATDNHIAFNQGLLLIRKTMDDHLPNAISFLISWIAFAGFKPFGQVLEQLRMV